MKNGSIILLMILLTSCEKDTGEIPPATTSGENTLAAYIDDDLWMPSIPGVWFGEDNRPNVEYNEACNILLVHGLGGDGRLSFISVVSGEGNYVLSPNVELPNSCWPDSINVPQVHYSTYFERSYNEMYHLTVNSQSTLKITHFDLEERIVSGTFSMTLYNSEGEALEITKGRFDSEVELVDYWK